MVPFAGADRVGRVRERMAVEGVDVLCLSHGADLPWLTGYRAMPLERLTMLVLPAAGEPVLVVPRLEAPRVSPRADLFTVLAWEDGDDPVDLVASLLRRSVRSPDADAGAAPVVAVSDRAWATSLLALQSVLPGVTWRPSSSVTAPVRAVKDVGEIAALRAAAAAADRVAAVLQAGEVPLVGRRESDVSGDLGDLLLAEGHQQVNFAIVGSGPNAASPHHEPGARVVGPDETVVCDFGGVLALSGDAGAVGYCSDITRTVYTGTPPAEIAECYEVLRAAQQAGVVAARAGVAAEAVDRATRTVIDEAGYGEHFWHRTGHGIGIEEHEDPYLVEGNGVLLEVGNAFSVEPGIYVTGRFGMRLEDIVVIGEDGEPERLNRADHAMVAFGP